MYIYTSALGPVADAQSSDAVAKARAWAERNLPPKPPDAARFDAA